MKRLLSITLALSLAISIFAGCGAKAPNSTPASTSESTGVSKVETNADREKVEIRFSQFGNSVDDEAGMKNDPIKKAIENEVNVALSYETGTDGYDDNIITQLAVGDAPDLFPTWGEADKIAKWISDGSVTDIGAIVAANPDRYPVLTKMFADETYKQYNKLYTGDENKVYAIYSLAAMDKPSFGGVPVYNTKILNEVNGGKVPTTVDEFVEFTNKAAKTGVTGWWPRNNKLTSWGEIDKTLAAPQGTTINSPQAEAWTGFVPTAPGADTWKLMTTSDESKAVVMQLRDMYKTKALDNGVGVKDDFTDAKSNFMIGKIASANYGFGYAGQFKDFYVSDWKAANPQTAKPEDLTMGVALKGSAGYGPTYSTFMWVGAHYFIPTSCKNPERVLDLVEFLASTKGQDLLHNCTDGTFNKAQGSDYWNNINKAYGYGEDQRCKYVWFSYLFSGTEYMTEIEKNGWYNAVTNPVDNSANWSSEEDNAMKKIAQDQIDTFVKDVAVKLPSYYNFIALPAEATELRTKLTEITNRYLPQMIGGQMDIEKEWPNYVAEYEKAGAKDLEKMLNDAVATAKG
ncbi:MAG: extracellular solute-binding protein [Christensenella sp.]